MAVVRSGAPYPLRRYRAARSSRKRLAAQGNGDLIPCQKCLAPRQIGDVGNVTALASSEDEQRFETSVPGASAFLTTRSLLDVVAEQHYAGPAWDELVRCLVRYALADLTKALRDGSIVRRCSRAGCGILRRPALQRDPFPEEIAAEAVEACLARLKEKILLPGTWDPTRGLSFESYFTACCLPDVANAYRRPLRTSLRGGISLDALLDEPSPRFTLLTTDTTEDPAEIVSARELIVDTLRPLGRDDQKALLMEASGWSRAEIATLLEVAPNTLDQRIRRARKKLATSRGEPE